jgi:uncharacterized membrane protein
LCLFAITLLIEVVITYIWTIDGHNWTMWEKAFCFFVFVCHVIFYVTLYYENRQWLDVMHVAVFVSTLFGVFLQSVPLLVLLLCLCVGIQLQWLFMNVCIMNSDEQNTNTNYGFSKLTAGFFLLYTCYLSFKIGSLRCARKGSLTHDAG